MLMLLAPAGPAVALTTLPTDPPDTQESAFPASNFAQREMAQVFTPQHTGWLTGVALRALTSGSTHPTVYVTISDTANGKPSVACALDPANTRTTVFPLQTLGQAGWQYIPLSQAVWVTAKVQYAIETCTATTNQFMWQWENAETYKDGGDPFLGSGAWMSPGGTVKAFDFMAWVASSGPTPSPSPSPSPTPVVNNPPVLDPPTTAAIQVAEGTVPTNSGTFRDPDGDPVSVTATPGSLTHTGTSQGSWTWTGAASDEVPDQTVTITAKDDHSHTVTRSFTVHVFGVAPTVSIAASGGTTSLLAATTAPKEGAPLSFTGTAHTPVAADTASLTYSWSVTKDGAPFDTPSSSTTSFTFTPNDEGSYAVTFNATDDGTMTGSASIPVVVEDVLPTAIISSVTTEISAPKLLLPYQLVTFTGTSKDPGTADEHTATWRFGDGTTATGWSAAHFYTSAGSYTVTLEVAQGDDPGVGTTTTTVVVMTPAQALGAIGGYIQSLPGLNNGQKNSLIAKLNAASDSAARGNTTAATNQLNAFLNELAADQKTGKVSDAEVANLESDITAVKGALGNYNRFLDFWPLGL